MSVIWLSRAAVWLCSGLLSLTVWAAPQRIITLTPHLTELVAQLGAGQRLVGVDEASDRPASIRDLPRVANYQSLNLEALLALHPDLVVAWDPVQRLQVAPLRRLGIPVYLSPSQSLTSLPDELMRLGAVLGQTDQARPLADHYRQRLDSLRHRYGHQKRIRVFYELWDPPLTTVAQGSWPDEVLELCGGDNPFHSSPVAYPQINLEQVLAADPAVILLAGQAATAKARWQRWPNIQAVARQALYPVNGDKLHRYTPALLDEAERICELLHSARQETKNPATGSSDGP